MNDCCVGKEPSVGFGLDAAAIRLQARPTFFILRALAYAIFLAAMALSAPVDAQITSTLVQLAVGSGKGQIGLSEVPNESCHGPNAIAAASDGRLAILDSLNKKIAIVGAGPIEDLPLPNDLVEPEDLMATTTGYLVAGIYGDVALISKSGAIIQRTLVKRSPEKGSVRLSLLSDGRVSLEELSGNSLTVPFSAGAIGAPVSAGFRTAIAYTSTVSATNRVQFKNNAIGGPLSDFSISSLVRIVRARLVWADDKEALAAVQEYRHLPDNASFVRLIAIDSKGQPMSEAYVGPEAYHCDIQRPFARLTDGRVVSLAFPGKGKIGIQTLKFSPIGSQPPLSVGQGSDVSLIAEYEGVLDDLQKLNGTSDASSVALTQISRQAIIDRAHAALNLQWQLAGTSYQHPNKPNLCQPPTHIWKRPPRLDGKMGQQVQAIPYRWGGYFRNIESFKEQLDSGRLAGDVCTCRKANCVDPAAIGLDCSGFVSFAWRTGNYFTTASLPNTNVSSGITWDQLLPGDIVNKARNHVRLVESTSSSPNGRIVTVIESTTLPSCGGVCRRDYLESDLLADGYKPLRRNGLME